MLIKSLNVLYTRLTFFKHLAVFCKDELNTWKIESFSGKLSKSILKCGYNVKLK